MFTNLTQETQLVCLGSIQKKAFFSFSYVVAEYFMHKGNNPIPKREQLACLAFVVVLPCYLLNRSLCDGKDFLNTHTQTQYIWGDAQVGAGSAERRRHRSAATASTTSPWGTHPCAQAIIVNDKVTIEVIIVLN